MIQIGPTSNKDPLEKKNTRHSPKGIPCDAVIFDIDNVLIDTRRSYLEAIRLTIDIFLTEGKIPQFSHSPKEGKSTLLSEEDVHQFKLLGGFNDDWDCCYGILVYLLSLRVKKRTMQDLQKAINIKDFAARVKKRPLGVANITKILKRPPALTIEKIGRIFQEIYLGRSLFRAVEAKSPFYWKKKGLIERERLIFKRRVLEKFTGLGIRLGIATGRPRFEALFALKQFEIADLFQAITTMDDVKRAEKEAKQSLRKPHPFSVLETAKKLGAEKNFLYVGDLPDDILAANEAKSSIRIHSVAFPTYGACVVSSVEEIQKAHPDFMIRSPGELIKLVRN